AYCGAASAACCCAAVNAWRQLDGSPVASLQASTEVYSPSCTCTVCSCWQAVNSSGAVLISSSAVVLDRFIIGCSMKSSGDDARYGRGGHPCTRSANARIAIRGGGNGCNSNRVLHAESLPCIPHSPAM